jgi:RNA-directed DNA polymerase
MVLINDNNISISPNPEAKIQWGKLPWKRYESQIEKIQRRIYYDTKHGMWKKVRDHQRLLLHSRAALVIAIRKITQENKGKYTAGLDGMIYQLPSEKLQLRLELKVNSLFRKEYKPMPTRRVWIPKNDEKMRPLGIPIVKDRIYEEMIRLVLEPEFEAKFHENSFGFRPGRCCQDAIEMIKKLIQQGFTTILDADLKKCFDTLSHSYLLSQIPSKYRMLIGKWLKAGVVDMGQLQKTEEGVPQGGVISPLLANIALNALDHQINSQDIRLIRYSDDFVVLSRGKVAMAHIIPKIQGILKEIGPELNAEKTRITTPAKGFSFLGFHLIQYPQKTLWVQPARERVTKFLKNLKHLISTNKQVKTLYLVLGLNQRIRGWAMYYRFCRAHVAFQHVTAILWWWVWRWCVRRHPKKGKRWIFWNYYACESGKKWRLTDDGLTLINPTDIRRYRYNWQVDKLSPFDPSIGVQELWQQKRDGKFYSLQQEYYSEKTGDGFSL